MIEQRGGKNTSHDGIGSAQFCGEYKRKKLCLVTDFRQGDQQG